MASNSHQFQQFHLKHTNANESKLLAPSFGPSTGCVTLLLSPWSQPLYRSVSTSLKSLPASFGGQVAPKVHGGSSCFPFWKRIDKKGGFGRNHWAVSILPPRNHQMHPARPGVKCRWQNSLWVSPWECRKCRRHPPFFPWEYTDDNAALHPFLLWISGGLVWIRMPKYVGENPNLCKIGALFKRNYCKYLEKQVKGATLILYVCAQLDTSRCWVWLEPKVWALPFQQHFLGTFASNPWCVARCQLKLLK